MPQSLHKLSRRALLVGSVPFAFGAKPGPVRVGCDTRAWNNRVRDFENLLAVLPSAKALGFDGFETSFAVVRSEFAHADPAYERLKKTSLRCLGIQVALKSYEPQTNLPSEDLLREVAQGAKALEAERIVISGASAIHPLALRAKADALNRVAKQCKDVGIACAYRTRQAEFQQGGEQIDGLVRATDNNVRLVFDAEGALAAGANAADFFAKNAKRIDAVHLAAAKGDRDYAPLAKAIQAANWKGWLVADESSEEDLRPAREAIRHTFGV